MFTLPVPSLQNIKESPVVSTLVYCVRRLGPGDGGEVLYGDQVVNLQERPSPK